MENQKGMKTLCLSFYQIFRDDLKNVFEILKDARITNDIVNRKIDKDTFSDIYFTKGSTSYEIGAKWSFIYRKQLKIYVTLVECTYNKDSAHLAWYCYKTEPLDIPYKYTYDLIRNTEDNTTLVKVATKFIYENIQISDKEKQQMLDDRVYAYKVIEKCVHTMAKMKTQVESISIKADFEKISELLLNLKLLQKTVPSICDKVDYEGDKISENMDVKFLWVEKVSMTVDIKIKSISQKPYWTTLVYECSDGSQSVPSQVVEWQAIKMEDRCFLNFTHTFKDGVNRKTLELISKDKKKILLKLKKAMDRK
jgi:hypothetical protein